MLCELEKDKVRITLQIVGKAFYLNGVQEEGGVASFHRVYIKLKLAGWKELQIYL